MNSVMTYPEHRHGEEPGSSPAAFAPLRLHNGCAAPLAAVPTASFGVFAHWLAARTGHGDRLSALFAVPARVPTSGPERAPEPEPGWRLLAVLNDSDRPGLMLASCLIGDRYPSLTASVPQAHLFERELHEKHGILPEGHPWLKPVRFSNPAGPLAGDMEFYRVEGDEVHEVAVGPIHAGVIECGHFRFQCLGEVVMHLEISLGYHHRGLEALLAGGPNPRTLPLIEVAAGDSTVAHAWAYCSVMEALADAPASPRGQIIRALGLELERLANHTGDLGAIAGDVGFLPTLSYCGRLRGDWLNMTARICGSRFGRGLVCPGGSAFEVDRAMAVALRDLVRTTARDVCGAVQLVWDSPSVAARLTGIGPLSSQTATALGLVGPAARACGIVCDVRHMQPLPGLPAPPEIAVASEGDVRARTAVRHEEVRASAAYCQRLLKDFLEAGNAPEPDQPPPAAPPLRIAPGQERIAVSLVEGWRGEVCHVAITEASGRFKAYQVVDPSFHNWMGLAVALRGQQISDFPLCNKSFNLSYCGHDL